MGFRNVLISVIIGSSLMVAAFLIHSRRPEWERQQPSPQFVRSTGKCAECHRHETAAVIHEFELSKHAAAGVTCMDCHGAAEKQTELAHRGFTITDQVTAANCKQCHETEYRQFLQSRHAAPSWAAVAGGAPFTAEQVAFSEKFHPGAVQRPPNSLALMEGSAAIAKGCAVCHEIGRPNADGSIGTCTACHSRHNASIAIARMPTTCGSCHMGPDHSQMEIYNESKHGVLFAAQRDLLNLHADPKSLTTRDMFVPTCATCHMSGLDGLKVTHDTSERLSYWLFADVSDRRPNHVMAQAAMQETCLKCHTRPDIEEFYVEAEAVLDATNERVGEAKALIDALRSEGLLTPDPFDEPIEFLYFDFWHYFGRTAKHGAFMGGADFVQWHGNYELVAKMAEMREMAKALRESPHRPAATPADSVAPTGMHDDANDDAQTNAKQRGGASIEVGGTDMPS